MISRGDTTTSRRVRRRRITAASAAVVLTFVTLAYQAATSLPATAVSGKVPLPPTGKAYFGTYSPPSPGKAWTTENQQNEYLNLERSLGRTLDVAQYYYDWSASFPTWRETWHVQSGRIPMISWDGINTDTVGSGSQDTLIRARADSVKAFAQPVFVRWMWEMDASWRGTTVRSPSSFIAAWRHIVTIFRTRGATNATFVWCPTAWGFESGVAQTYYPGDSYVDWICADAYNWAPGRRGAKWRQLSEAIPTFYAWSMPHGKPLMLGEYGCQERSANEKATWFSTVRTDLKSKFPGIRAVVYFDSYTLYDWRLDTSTSALNAFKSMARDSYFNP